MAMSVTVGTVRGLTEIRRGPRRESRAKARTARLARVRCGALGVPANTRAGVRGEAPT